MVTALPALGMACAMALCCRRGPWRRWAVAPGDGGTREGRIAVGEVTAPACRGRLTDRAAAWSTGVRLPITLIRRARRPWCLPAALALKRPGLSAGRRARRVGAHMTRG